MARYNMEEYSTQELLQSILVINDENFCKSEELLFALYGKSVLRLYCMPAQSVYTTVPVHMKTMNHSGS